MICSITERQCCSRLLSTMHIAFKLIKQLLVTYIHKFGYVYTLCLIVIHRISRFYTSYCKLLNQLECYMLDRAQARALLSKWYCITVLQPITAGRYIIMQAILLILLNFYRLIIYAF